MKWTNGHLYKKNTNTKHTL